MTPIAQGSPEGSPNKVANPSFECWQRIPHALRKRPQWALAAPESGKAPRTASGGPASSTNPATWTDFDTACAEAAKRGWQVGYMLHETDPFSCVDLDVKPSTPPEHVERFHRIIAAMDSYTERSCSGLGWHIWVEGSIGRGRKRDGVEVYSQERFIICTGDVVRHRAIAERHALLTKMMSQMEPPTPEILMTGDDRPDMAIVERARADQGQLGKLFRGELTGLDLPTPSEADLALVKLLLPLTSSPRECWATFQLSELGKREKDGRRKADRPDYARRTLAIAAQHVGQDHERLKHGRTVALALLEHEAAKASQYFRLLVDGDLDRLPRLRWFVKGVVPDAGIGAIYGDSGTFKSFLTLDLLAHISNGKEWFGHRVKAAPAVYVPFEGQGGVPNRIRAWRLAETIQRNPHLLLVLQPDDGVRSRVAVIMESLNLRDAADREKLVATLKASGWSGGILCVDTLAHASAGIEENSSAMGEMIAIFRDLQLQLGGVILLVHHSGKDQSRGMRGWSGLHAAMDFVIECQKDGDDDRRQASFRLSKVKDGTTGTTFKFRMQLVPLGHDEDGDPITSLTVCPHDDGEQSEHPFEVDGVQEALKDDDFVDAWVRRLMGEGKRPTGRSLDGQLPLMKAERPITQKRLRDAIARLKVEGRLVDVPGGPSGSKWLRAVDLPQVAI